jgi:hypothetical protein
LRKQNPGQCRFVNAGSTVYPAFLQLNSRILWQEGGNSVQSSM